MKIYDLIGGGGVRKMFPLEKSAEARQMPEGKAGEKRRSSNSHLTTKMEPGWGRWELTTAGSNLGKTFCWKNNPCRFCQTYHTSCTFKSVKLPASIRISKHLLLLKHLKKTHTQAATPFFFLQAKLCHVTRCPQTSMPLSWLARTKLLGDYACTVSSFLHFALWGKRMYWSRWGTGFSVTREPLLWTSASPQGYPREHRLHLRQFLILPAKIHTGQVSVVVSRRMPL